MEQITESFDERPKGLTILCALSWISIGISIYFSLMNLVRGPFTSFEIRDMKVQVLEMKQELEAQGMGKLSSFFEKSQEMTIALNEHHGAVLFVNFLFLAIGAVGVWFMFSGRKLGFHLYIMYCLLSVLHPYFFMSGDMIPIISPVMGGVLSLIFIALYSQHLKWMK